MNELKSMLIEVSEDTVDEQLPKILNKVKEELVEVDSKHKETSLATWLNKHINLPVLNEAQEQKVFEKATGTVSSFGKVFLSRLIEKYLKKYA